MGCSGTSSYLGLEMLSLSLTVPLTILSCIALFINAVILFVVILSKQVSPSNILLFHLGVVESLLCIIFLIFAVPLLSRNDEIITVKAICTIHGFLITLLHPIALWTVCGLNCDRYYAIAAPLHYNAIFNPKKVACGLACGWFVAILATIPPFFDVAPYTYNSDVGVCTPFFSSQNSLWYAIAFTICTLIIPGSIIILCNLKVFMIARYHRHRIAAAIFEVTLSAQVTITHQRNPFPLPFEAIPPKLRSRSPLSNVFQIVGSFVLLYIPYYMTILWNSSIASLHNGNIPKSLEMPRYVIVVTSILIHLSIFINGIIYGIKSKVMRKSIQNYWRKKKTKDEINQEIQARTPSTCGSRRPSINAMSFFQRPIAQRRLSETFVDQAHASERPQIKRIASELSWRPLTLQFDPSPTEPVPHSSSVNTLQIPNADIESTEQLSTEQEKFLNLRNSIRSSMRSYNQKTMNSNMNASSNMSTRHSKSSLNVATALLQKVFRIDLSDTYRRAIPNKQNEPLSPLRSPQILITSANSDDSDQTNQASPVKMSQKPYSLTNLFERHNSIRYEKEDKINDSDTESIFTPDQNSSRTDVTMFSKRCFSLDEQPKYDTNSISAEEQLLLSWPTTRKKYKLLKEYEPNVNPLFNDRCEEPEIVL